MEKTLKMIEHVTFERLRLTSCIVRVRESTSELAGGLMNHPHRYSSTTFSKSASRKRAYGWLALVSLFIALSVLTLYILQTMGVIG